jgi:hypothetical protein
MARDAFEGVLNSAQPDPRSGPRNTMTVIHPSKMPPNSQTRGILYRYETQFGWKCLLPSEYDLSQQTFHLSPSENQKAMTGMTDKNRSGGYLGAMNK